MKEKKKSGRSLAIFCMVVVLVIVVGVILWRMNVYRVGESYYDSLRDLT